MPKEADKLLVGLKSILEELFWGGAKNTPQGLRTLWRS